MNGDTLPVDARLPGLGIATDHRHMLAILRRHLRPVPTNAHEILDCRLSRIHYHRTDRCTLRYTLRLVDRTGGERNLWITGQMFAGDHAGEIWRRFRAIRAGEDNPEAFPIFEPISFIPCLNMVVQIFPYDRHLPTLSRLLACPLRDLEPLFLRQFGSGQWHIERCTALPVQYRAGRAAVLRYEVCGRTALKPTTAVRRFYAKIYRRQEQAEQTHRTLQALWDTRHAGRRSFTVAKPVACLANLQTLVQEEVPGTSLRQMLLDGGDTSSAVQRTARALAAFRIDQVAGLPRHGPADEVAALRTAAQILTGACPELQGQVESIVNIIAAGMSDVPLESTHRELRTDHIFLDRDRVAVVDIDSLTRADPVLDPARLLADFASLQLQLRSDPSNAGRLKGAAQELREEYFRLVPRVWRDRLPGHYAGALLKEAVDCFRHLQPHWQENVATLVDEAEKTLSRPAR